jgi:hypothetical protein
MSKLSKKNNIALVMACAAAFTVSLASPSVAWAQSVEQVLRTGSAIHQRAAVSQVKIDKVFDQTQNLLNDYRQVVSDTDALRAYNDYVAALVTDQQSKLSAVAADIEGIDKTRQGLVPLMLKMIDSIDDFVALDLPFEREERADRIGYLREMMVDSNVTTAEKYRKVLEAYQIEMDAGRFSAVTQGKQLIDGIELTVNTLQVGRIALVAQTLDVKKTWVWNVKDKAWQALDDSWRRPIRDAIAIVRKDKSPALILLPVAAVGSVQ